MNPYERIHLPRCGNESLEIDSIGMRLVVGWLAVCDPARVTPQRGGSA